MKKKGVKNQESGNYKLKLRKKDNIPEFKLCGSKAKVIKKMDYISEESTKREGE